VFWLKEILYLSKYKIIYSFMIFVAGQKSPPPPRLLVVGSGMDKNQYPVSGINIPDPPHCLCPITIYVGQKMED
jgi:hypothetical protein